MPGEFRGSRGLAQIWLESLVEAGLTNTEIVEWLRGNEMSYRTSYMYQDVNRTRLELMGAAEISGLDQSMPIPERLLRLRDINTDFPYSVVVKFEYFDLDTQTKQTQGVTLYYSQIPSQAQVMEDFSLRKEGLEKGIIDSPPNVEEVYQVTKVYYYQNKR